MTMLFTRGGSRASLSASLSQDADDEPNINLMPLIDVVLIVLIFFITTTSFIPPSDAAKAVEIRSATDAAAQDEQQDANRARIVLTADNAVLFNGEPYAPAALGKLFAARLAERADLSVVIDADERARVSTLLEVIRHLQANGVDNIALGDESNR